MDRSYRLQKSLWLIPLLCHRFIRENISHLQFSRSVFFMEGFAPEDTRDDYPVKDAPDRRLTFVLCFYDG